ncbi:uncharacterized protein [Malus domestica]|uniref:uncharacterized protein n=1 Tax=Malus domestica TaxID=3750 RepID=UPI003974BD58
MTDSVLKSMKGLDGEGSHKGKGKKMKKAVVTIEKHRRKHLPSFADKSSAEAYAELNYDIGGLVRDNCSIEFNSWKMVHVDVKNSMVVWDVDETDEKQQKYVDELMKKKFRKWKFDVQQAAIMHKLIMPLSMHMLMTQRKSDQI